MRNNERWSIVMFILILGLAIFEFVFLPDGIGLRMGDGLKHYCRIKPYEIMVPVAIASFGAGLVHHGTIKKGLVIFAVGIAVFLGTIIYQM